MSKTKQAKVFHFDLYGKREEKYDFLNHQSIDSIQWAELEVTEPNFLLINKDFSLKNEYELFLKITDFFPFKTSGIKTHDDANLISQDIKELQTNIEQLINKFENIKITKYFYRPFDIEYLYYDTELLGRAREKTIYHLKCNNIGLILVAQSQAANLNYFDCAYITNLLTDTNMFRRGGPNIFPLYLYPVSNGQQTIGQSTERTPNLNMGIVGKIAENLSLQFTKEKEQTPGTFAPIDILDYIYAVLHSPRYREKYKEFLKIDFPRIPYPKDTATFWSLVALGGELRQIHLLESPIVNQFITTYPINGNNIITKPRFESLQSETRQFTSSPLHQLGQVWINERQYFNGVPLVAWEFYIGGYQPAQKWLKDRKGRILSYEDIQHYQKIIVALTETDRLMKEIDKIDIE
jgi:predicted helicase